MGISLLSFLKTGSLDKLSLGISRKNVECLIGKPDNWGAQVYRSKADIWLYGNIEIYFSRETDLVNMIFTDHFELPSKLGSFDVDPWIIRKGMAFSDLIRQTELKDFSFIDATPAELKKESIWYQLPSKVILAFSLTDNDFSSPMGLNSLFIKNDE